jgi:protein associated with RNAse G/E
VTAVEVRFSKYDGRAHRHTVGQLLGEDEHGVWLGSPPGTLVHYLYAGVEVPGRSALVRLIPPGGWWTAIFFAGDREPAIYCDITMPAHWLGPAEVTFIDLDLDVEQYRDGRVVLLDEDEFAEHTSSLGYPPEVIVQASAAAQHVLAAIAAGQEPFRSAYLSWLSRV